MVTDDPYICPSPLSSPPTQTNCTQINTHKHIRVVRCVVLSGLLANIMEVVMANLLVSAAARRDLMANNVVLALSPSSAALTGALAAGGVDLCKADEAEGGGVSLTWHLDTKYYSADVRLRGKSGSARMRRLPVPCDPCASPLPSLRPGMLKVTTHDPQLTV